MQIPEYTFDSHTCFIEIASWDGLSVSGLQWDISLSSEHELLTAHYLENSEWDLKNTSISEDNPRYNDHRRVDIFGV